MSLLLMYHFCCSIRRYFSGQFSDQGERLRCSIELW